MSSVDNEKRAGGRVRVGLFAPAGEQAPLAAAIGAVPELDFCGQCGLRQSEALPNVPWFDDARIMLAQGGVELVVLGGSLREASEHAIAALEHGAHVWRLPPLGRTFAESIAAARIALRTRPVYQIASWWDGVVPTVRAVQRAGATFTAPSYCDLYAVGPGPAAGSWRASRTESGGGVLIHDAYAPLEGLVALRGLPETVSSAVGAFRHRRGASTRDGEDTVAAVLRFADGAIASMRCGWDLAQPGRWSAYHGEDWSLTIDERSVTARSASDPAALTSPIPADVPGLDLARAFRRIREPEAELDWALSIERHVAVAALIDTIYLAARTHQPETPHKLYEVQGWPLPQKR